jgi:hypothetical protein
MESKIKTQKFSEMENGKWKMRNGKAVLLHQKWKMENAKWEIRSLVPASCSCRLLLLPPP